MVDLSQSVPVRWPVHEVREGQFIRLEPLDPERHTNELYTAGHAGEEGQRIWDYLPYGPFADEAAMAAWHRTCAKAPDPQFYAVIDLRDGRAAGVCSFLRITPEHAVIEVGHIWYAPHLQRTFGATEAMYLLFCHVFDEFGYRRLEWKCNAANSKSRQAALRLGFTFEGIFRQHLVVKGRNRDSAWFSILDHEWPAVKAGMEAWLAAGNSDHAGRQIQSLAECRATAIVD